MMGTYTILMVCQQ